jgi:hypothetical protein
MEPVMRLLVFAALFSLTACALAPAPKGSAAEHQLAEIRSVRLAATMEPLNLVIDVDAMAPTPGFTDLTLKPVTYIQRPPDGIYDVTAVGTPPDAFVPAVLDRVEYRYRWTGFPSDLRGVRVHASGNSIVAMLPGR